MTTFRTRIQRHVEAELQIATRLELRGDVMGSFHHLERAHVLGQAFTVEHVRVHLRMLRWVVRQRDVREVRGQLLRIIGAATKTAVGLVPRGNTGGAGVNPFESMPIPDDLAKIMSETA
jgi:hypothetical protein